MKIGNLIAVSQIFQRGASKMKSQAAARYAGATGSHQVAQRTGIHSDETYRTYRAVWQQYFDYARSELGIRHIERSTTESVARYLEHRIEQGIERTTWNKEASAMNKLAVALNMTSEKLHWSKHFEFSSSIDSLRGVAREELNLNSESRAYASPPSLISSLSIDRHHIAAALQHEGGARIREISNLSPEQFRGLTADRVTGQPVGVIHIDNGKGGYARDMYVSLATYEQARAVAETEGTFSFNQSDYRSDLKQAAETSGHQYSGSHGLRWSYAQEMVTSLQQHGLSYEQALQETSERLGHHRLDITEHYLR